MMRLTPLLGLCLGLLAALPAFGQSSEGELALAGLERIGRELCGLSGPVADPQGLALGLEGPIGDAMGLRNADSIIGSIYAGDPQAGAQMWASTATRYGAACDTLLGILTRPASETIAELR